MRFLERSLHLPDRIYKEYMLRFSKEISARKFSLETACNLLSWLDVLETGKISEGPSWPFDNPKPLLKKIKGPLKKVFGRSEKARFQFISYLLDLHEDYGKINEFWSRFQNLWRRHEFKKSRHVPSLSSIGKEMAQGNFQEAQGLMLSIVQQCQYEFGWQWNIDETEEIENFDEELSQWSSKSSQQNMDEVSQHAEFAKILKEILGDKNFERADEISWGLEPGIWRDYGEDFMQHLDILKDKKEIKKLVQNLGRNPSDETGEPIEGFKQVAAHDFPQPSDCLDFPPAGYQGYEYGRDVTRLAPSALTLLADKDTEFLFDVKFVKYELALRKPRRIISDIQAKEGGSAQKRVLDPKAQREPAQRGPIVALIDTSGSMSGKPTDIAKAVLLVMALIAYAEKRPVFALNFSSYRDIEAMEVGIASDAIKEFINFLRYSHGGGTEPLGALEKALEKVEEGESWHKADLVMISDGYFGGHGDMTEQLKKSQEAYGTRLFGVCVQGNTNSFEQLCEKKHVFYL